MQKQITLPSCGRWHRFWKRLHQALRAKIDPVCLRQTFPQFKDYDRMSPQIKAVLLPYYRDYITNVSTADAAISLELAVFLTFLCETFGPRRILDLGSGFSSFVFRHYQAKSSPPPEVWSVDNSADWLDKTRGVLASHHLAADYLTDWDGFSKEKHEPFDLVLHDLGDITQRLETLERVIRWTKQGGLIVLDDMQKIPYGPYAREVVKKLQLNSFHLRSYTRDSFHRFSYLVVA